MNRIKILEVNNIDLAGRRFNGYNMLNELSNKDFDIKQAVIIKQSDNDNVIKILNNERLLSQYYHLFEIEEALSIHNIFSITAPALYDMEEYKEADIVHLHMFHNTKLSLYDLKKIAKEKRVVLSLHDPWFFTGRCVHFYECDSWKKGCKNCQNLNTLFPLKKDNCNALWNLKKYVFNNSDINIIVSSPWMKNLVEESPITKHQKNVSLIPFGIDWKKFSGVTRKEARTHYNFNEDDVVLFLRAQDEFKGTNYVLEALKNLNTKKNIVVLTCSSKGKLDEVKNKYKVIDLGEIKDAEMLMAMNACDIFLMPSIGESFGMMAIEAMSCKKPVIVFNNTALPSVTHAPDCGYLVKNKDAKDLEKAIKYLVEHEEERKRRGKLGLEIVKKEYDLNTYNKKLSKLYKEVNKNKKTDSNLKERASKQDIKNINKIKCLLNYVTEKTFYGNKKIGKNLLYKVDEKYDVLNEKITFDNIDAENLIEDYNKKVYELLKNNQINTNSKFKKGLYLLKRNPKELMKIIYKKIFRE